MNARDIGGYIPSFPTNLIYRSSAPTPTTLPLFSPYISLIIDLRSQSELHYQPTTPVIPILNSPIFGISEYTPTAIQSRLDMYTTGVSGFIRAYQGILDNLQGTMRDICRGIRMVYGSGKGVLVHCAVGKDRTGVVVALLLLMGGVSDDMIIGDYAMSEYGLEKRVEEIKRVKDVDKRKKWLEMVKSPREVMARLLEVIRKEYGGYERFVRGMVGDEEYDAVVEILHSGGMNGKGSLIPSKL